MRGPTSDTKIEFADLDKSFRADDTYTKQLSRFQTIHVDQTIQYVDTDFQLQDGYNTLLELIEAPPPDSVLLRQEGFEKVTYGDLRKFIETEGDLRRFGVRKNDAIAYITAPGAVGAVSFLSCGVQTCVCPMDRRANKQEIFDACNQLLVKFYIYFKGSLDNVNLNACTLDELTEVCDTLGITIIEATLDKGGKAGFYTFEPGDEDVDNAEPLRTEPEDVICMLRTSGSTGPPKAVPLHQSGIVQNGLALAEILELKSTDINLNVMPLFHIGGLSCCVLASMTKGASLICMEGFNEQDFIGILAYEEDAPTWYHAVPAVHKAILQHCNGLAPEHRLRFIRSGAASLKHEAAVELSELFGVPVIPTYSMSEQMPIVQVPADYRLEKENSVGVPNACSLLIIDKEWDTVDWETGVKEPCPHGKVGEVCISGPTVMNGYLNNETANRKSFFTWNNKEWFTTGDLGIIDEEGYLLLKGRKKNMIKKNGEQVSPFEVEEAVEAFAEIKTALAFPVPDEALGEGVGVMLILNDDHLVIDELAFYRSIRARCADKLMAFKVPDYIYKCKDR